MLAARERSNLRPPRTAERAGKAQKSDARGGKLEATRASRTRSAPAEFHELTRGVQGECAGPVDAASSNARLSFVDVVLRKLGKGSRAVAGRLVRAPRKGSVVVIEFPDGMHEYVTTPVKRVLRLAGREVFYIETINSRYRLEVRSRQDALAESAG